MAQGPNMWWNFKKSKIWTIPNKKDQAKNWFLIEIIYHVYNDERYSKTNHLV